jgi:hypothetical protein
LARHGRFLSKALCLVKLKALYEPTSLIASVEKLPPKRKQIVQILDAFLGSEKAKKTG